MVFHKAYSLIELVVVVALVGIVLVFSIPAYNSFLIKAESDRYRMKISQAFEYARQQAVQRNVTVTLCAVDIERHCVPVNEWANGFIIYINPLQQSQPQQAADILNYYQAPKNSAHLYWNGFGQHDNISILADGTLDYYQGTFSYRYGQSARYGWDLILNAAGRLRFKALSD